ncbi:hypothetical protein IGI04_006344 [Brassica rapa subsp. trilocularis]|uniref:Uncharacterized protein n=1 Tax=Brassica rapa subsp. trilocularis TaxID=1813537 RepID=A0ABQ7NGM3_BRACM|nr:hypothetical protein IGI04_006344 [Brassica rapa subsp. trilocularis]
MPLWRETSVELSSLRSKGLHPCGQCWICFCALRSKGSLAVSVLLRPFSFEGRRRLEEVAFLCCCATNKVTSSPAFTISRVSVSERMVVIMVLSRGSQLLTGVRIRDIKSEQKWTADSGDTAVLSLAIVNLPVGVRPSKNLNSSLKSCSFGCRRFYRRQPQDAAFGRGVRRSFLRQRNEQELTQNVDAAAAAGTCGNQTNSPSDAVQRRRNVQGEMAFLKERETVLLPFLSQGRVVVGDGSIYDGMWLKGKRCGLGTFYSRMETGGFISTKVIDGLQISGKEMPAVKEGSIQSQVRYSLDISKMDGDMDSSSV